MHSVHMEGRYTIYRTHHIKGMMSPSYYIYIYIYIYGMMVYIRQIEQEDMVHTPV